jgi:exopolysaccharide production protein ExoQ
MKTAQVIVYISCLLFVSTMWHDFRSLWRGPNRLDLVWLVAICGWPFVVTLSVAPLLFGEARHGSGQDYVFLAYGPAVFLGAFIFSSRLFSKRANVFSPSSLLLFGTAIALLPFSYADSRIALITLALYLPTILIASSPDPFVALATAARLAASAILVAMVYMVTYFPEMSLGPCRADKCGVAGVSLFSSYSGNGNIYGIALVLLLPLALYGMGIKRTILMVSSVSLVSDICLSRTADVALLFVVVGAFVLVGGRQTTWARLITGTLLGGAFILSFLPFWSTYDGQAYSLRGMLWERAIQETHSSPLVGTGASGWTGLQPSGDFSPSYSPHNIWLGISTMGGLLLTCAVIAALILVVFLLQGSQRLYMLLFLTSVLAIGTFESPILPVSLGILPFAWLIPLWLSSNRPISDVPPFLSRRLVRIADGSTSGNYAASDSEPRGDHTVSVRD